MNPLLIPAIAKGGLGLYQLLRGSFMNPKRPTYSVPGEQTEELALSRQQASGRMPGIGYAEQRLQQNQANAGYGLRRGATNPNQLLSGIAGIQSASNAAERGLLESEASDRFRRVANLSRSLSVMSNYRDKAFDYNKNQPFQNAARTKAALTQGGLTNLFGGLSDISSMGMYKNMYGGGYNQYGGGYGNNSFGSVGG